MNVSIPKYGNQIINPHFSYFIDIKISISSSGIILQNAIQCSFSDAFHIDKTISDLTWGISLRVYVINVLKNRVHDFFLIWKVFCLRTPLPYKIRYFDYTTQKMISYDAHQCRNHQRKVFLHVLVSIYRYHIW